MLALTPLLGAGAGAIAQLPFHRIVVRAPSWRAGGKSLYSVLNCEFLCPDLAHGPCLLCAVRSQASHGFAAHAGAAIL